MFDEGTNTEKTAFWRDRLFDYCVKWYAIVIPIIWLAVYVLLPHSEDFFLERSLMGNLALMTTTFSTSLFFLPKFPKQLGKLILIAIPFSVGMTISLSPPIPGNGSIMMGFAAIMASLLLGNRMGAFVFLSSLAVIFIPAFEDLHKGSENSEAWLIVLFQYLLVFTATLSAISYLVSYLESNYSILKGQNAKVLSSLDSAAQRVEQFNLFNQASSDLLWTANLDFTFTYISPSVERLSGYTVDEAMTRGIRGMLSAEDLEKASLSTMEELQFDAERDPNRTVTLILRHRKKDGTYYDAELVSSFIRDEDGKPTGVQGISRDISQRRRLDIAMESVLEGTRHHYGDEYLAAIAKNLAHVLDVKYVMIGMLSDENTIETLVVCHSGELIENFEYSLKNGPCEFASQKSFCKYPRNVQSVFPNYPMLGELGAESYLGVAMLGVDKEMMGMVVCMDDKAMSEEPFAENLVGIFAANIGVELQRRRSESEKEIIQQQLLQAQRLDSLGKLAGGVAHDFNNLLSVIGGYVDMAEKLNNEDPVMEEYHLQIQGATKRAAKLTRQMLTFSRRQVMEKMPLDLNSIINGLEGLLTSLLPEDISLEIDLGVNLGVVDGDAGQLEQVIMNLVVNARDAMSGGGNLLIETRNVSFGENELEAYSWASEGEFVRLRIRDDGTGIPPEIVGHIFEPFFTTKAEGEGTGLGLSVCFGVIKQHNGFTKLRSKVGTGTQFNTYLPIVKLPLAETKSTNEPSDTGGEETILVVEDDKQVRELAYEMLSGAGYKVMTAENGKIGVDLYKRYKDEIDLIIMDVVMPVMNGHEAMNEILAVAPEARILFTSGYAEEGIHTNFILSENLILLPKPYGLRDLLSQSRLMLEKESSLAG